MRRGQAPIFTQIDDPFETPAPGTRPPQGSGRQRGAVRVEQTGSGPQIEAERLEQGVEPTKEKGSPGIRFSALNLIFAVCFNVPTGIFVIVSIVFALFWKNDPLRLIFIASCFVPLFTLPAFYGSNRGSTSPLPTMAGIWAVTGGFFTGLYAHEAYVAPFLAMSSNIYYKDVLANSSVAAYADAGMITFADTSTVDVSRVVGYRNRRTFCVAPIIDSGSDQQGKPIGFWAVGLDCCGARDDFECGDAGSGGSHGGVRVAPAGLLEQSTEEYLKAIAQASAVYDIQVEKDPLLLRWVKNTTTAKVKAFGNALGTLLLGTAFFVLFLFLATALSELVRGGRTPKTPL
eukprot:TRINITY_DN63777_c0_g1_i1.p1 TRINITY_DN63777_c0_g1~~TRINITY_DN63777_c0_g1_i1.p1  ORF type:complete len:345 (-),score=61.74 TRINITY_DN63777_c0_g1_i1:102-1136(-)